MLTKKRERGVNEMDDVGINDVGINDVGVNDVGINDVGVNDVVWCPGEVAFTMQRLIIQRYFLGDAEDRCTICLEDLEKRMTLYLPCKHAFHYKCWQNLIEQRTYTCPLCRENFSEALPAVGILQNPAVTETAVLTIFTHIDFYDFMLELLLWNYENDIERNILAENIFD